jgi:hypothetical protein
MPAIVYIVSEAYVPQLRASINSFRKHSGPEWKIIVGTMGELPDIAEADIQTNIATGAHFRTLNEEYTEREQVYALKPVLVNEVLTLFGFDACIFLGADVMFYGDITQVFLRTPGAFAACPHRLTPGEAYLNGGQVGWANLTGQLNSDIVFYRRSIEVLQFLDWQATILKNDCVYDKERGLFFDQTPLQFAFSFISSTNVIRHPGVNTAWYNLDERTVYFDEQEERLCVKHNNKLAPLIAFHFSGFDSKRPATLSKYTRNPKIITTTLVKLIQAYAAEVSNYAPIRTEPELQDQITPVPSTPTESSDGST